MKIEVIVKIDGVEVSKYNVTHDEPSNGDSINVSQYARFFDSECFPNWSNDPMNNLFFLRHTEAYATNLLKSRYVSEHEKGHLYLNEVYDMLGLPRTIEGQFVGWVYPNDGMGDDYVSFDLYSERNREFINGTKNSVLLDFNVDGCILGKF